MAVRAVREPSLPQPPDHLSPTAAAWWTAVVAEFDLEAHQLVILEAAADAYDRMLECRAIVLTEGAVVRDRYDKPKTHPAALLERDSRLSLLGSSGSLRSTCRCRTPGRIVEGGSDGEPAT
jgi:phage terminase small subunit